MVNLLTGFNNTHAGPGQSTLLTIVDFGADVGHMMEAFLDILPQFSHVPLVLVLLCDEESQKEWLEHKAVTLAGEKWLKGTLKDKQVPPSKDYRSGRMSARMMTRLSRIPPPNIARSEASSWIGFLLRILHAILGRLGVVCFPVSRTIPH